MLKEKRIYQELSELTNAFEIAFSENMQNYIYVVCNVENANLLSNTLKSMFKEDKTFHLKTFRNGNDRILLCGVE